MHVYNPEGFDPARSLTAWMRRYTDCARMLVHLVAVKHAWDDRDELEYVPLKASILRRQVHPHATEAVRDELIACGVIECDGKYRVGQKCLGYRFATAHRRQRFVSVKLTDKALIRRNESQPRVPEPELSGGVHEMMWHWLNQTEIDYAGAVERLTAEGTGLRNVVRKSVGLEQLRARELFFTSDQQGRVYHNVVNLWSEFRPFLRLDGERLVNLDIRNSQPLLFSICLGDYFRENNKVFKPSPLSPTYFSDAHKSTDGLTPDASRYIELCEQGMLYDSLMAEFGIDPERRGEFKKAFFASVFFSKDGKRGRHVTGFAERFPTVYEAIRHFKRHRHSDLPLLMQRTEAALMIGTVCGRLVGDHRHVPFLTIHDSVLTVPRYAGLVKEIILAAFAGVGLRPTVNTTEY